MADPVLNGLYPKQLDQLTSIALDAWLAFQPDAVSDQAYRISLENFIAAIPTIPAIAGEYADIAELLTNQPGQTVDVMYQVLNPIADPAFNDLKDSDIKAVYYHLPGAKTGSLDDYNSIAFPKLGSDKNAKLGSSLDAFTFDIKFRSAEWSSNQATLQVVSNALDLNSPQDLKLTGESVKLITGNDPTEISKVLFGLDGQLIFEPIEASKIQSDSDATDITLNDSYQEILSITGSENIALALANIGLTAKSFTTGSITVFADASDGRITVTSATHGLSEGDFVEIVNTTNYDGTYEIKSVPNINDFIITATFVATETGDWEESANREIAIDLRVNEISVKEFTRQIEGEGRLNFSEQLSGLVSGEDIDIFAKSNTAGEAIEILGTTLSSKLKVINSDAGHDYKIRYIDTDDGDDLNDGSFEFPIKTAQQAFDLRIANPSQAYLFQISGSSTDLGNVTAVMTTVNSETVFNAIKKNYTTKSASSGTYRISTLNLTNAPSFLYFQGVGVTSSFTISQTAGSSMVVNFINTGSRIEFIEGTIDNTDLVRVSFLNGHLRLYNPGSSLTVNIKLHFYNSVLLISSLNLTSAIVNELSLYENSIIDVDNVTATVDLDATSNDMEFTAIAKGASGVLNINGTDNPIGLVHDQFEEGGGSIVINSLLTNLVYPIGVKQAIAATLAIPFTKLITKIAPLTITGATEFTVVPADADVDYGNMTFQRITANGVDEPDHVHPFQRWLASRDYDNTLDTVNLIARWFDGVSYYYSWGQAEPLDTQAPSYVSSEVGTIDDTTIRITMDEACDATSTPAASAFTLAGIASSPTITNVNITGVYVDLTLSAAVVPTDSPTVAYTKPGTNPLKDTPAGNETASWTAETVTNNVVVSIIVMQDDFAGTTIDTGKWTETDPADGVTITQNNELIFTITGTVASSNVNHVDSVDTVGSGGAQIDIGGNIVKSTQVFGFGADENNEAQLLHLADNANAQTRTLVSGAGSLFDTGIAWLGNTFKTVIESNDDIKYYYLSAPDTWTQMGSTDNNDYGTSNRVRFASSGHVDEVSGKLTNFDNAYLTNANYNTSVPV